MNDNEFKKLIKNEFDNVKAAPSAEERILRRLKGADTMEEKTNNIISSAAKGAEVKKRWGAGIIAAALALTIGVGGIIALNSKGNKPDVYPAPASEVLPLGLPEAEGKEGLYKVNDNTYFSPINFDQNEGSFESEDGMISGKTTSNGEAIFIDRVYPTPSYLTDYYVKWTNNMNGREIETADYYIGYNVQTVLDGDSLRFVTDCGRGEYHTEQSGGMAGSFEQFGLVSANAKGNPGKVTFRAVIKTTDGNTICYGMYNSDVTADTEGYEDVSTLKLIDDEDAYAPDETPLGLPAAEGRDGLYELGENSYFCPLLYYNTDTYVSEDGRVRAILGYGTEAERDYVPAEGNRMYEIDYSVDMPEFAEGTFFAGFDVYATELLETYPLQIGYSMGTDIVEQGVEYRKSDDDGDTITVLVGNEAPEYLGYSSVTPRVIITTENGETIQYALAYNYNQKEPAAIETQESEDTDSSESGDSSAAESSDSDEASEADSIAEDESSDEASAADSTAEDESSVDVGVPTYADHEIQVGENQVIILLIREGDTFTSVDGKLKAEYFIRDNTPYIRWTNNSGTELNGDFTAGVGIDPYIGDEGDGPKVFYTFRGTEQGIETELAAGESVEIEVPLSGDYTIENVGEDVTPRVFFYSSDGKEYIYAMFNPTYNPEL